MINKAMIIGRLGKDPEVRYNADGGMITSFTVATDESYKNKSGEKVQKTEWHNVTTFGKLAEICGKYLVKGSLVFVEGKIQTDKWTDKHDVTRYTTRLVANEMKMLGEKKGEKSQPAPEPLPDNDVPF